MDIKIIHIFKNYNEPNGTDVHKMTLMLNSPRSTRKWLL